MQYELYEQKVAKVANFLKLLFRHKIKIIIALAFMIISACTLAGFKGTIVSAGEIPEDITYGDTTDFGANAFLSDTYYEYCPKGENRWSTEFPTEPGEYKVRAAASAIFGTRYSDERRFILHQREATVKIADSSCVYGEPLSLSASNSAPGDTVKYLSVNEGFSGYVTPDASYVKIYNASGKDVTSAYSLSYEASYVTTVSRSVTVTVKDATKTYDGTPLSATSYEITSGSILKGDKLKVDLIGSVTDANKPTAASADCAVTNSDGDNVTRFYNFNIVKSTLTVVPRDITVTTENQSFVYNGSARQHRVQTNTNTLVSGHSINFNSHASITDVGTVENSCTAVITDPYGQNVSKNYNITYKFGTLTVTPLKLNVTTATSSTEYNGEDFYDTYLSFSGSGLAYGDRYEPTSYTKASGHGTFKNSVSFKIYNSNGRDATKNYEFTVTEGTLTVTKRAIFVETESYNNVYDGNEHNLNGLYDVYGRLCNGHTIVATSDAVYKNATNETKNKTSFEIRDRNGNNVSENYEISTVYGTVVIIKRDITAETESYYGEYDGKPHSLNSVIDVYGSLCEGHYFKITSAAKEYKNVYNGRNDTVTYYIADETGTDVSVNYNITRNVGSIVIYEREIAVETEGYVGIYDGKSHEFNRVSVYSGTLCDGHTFVVTSDPKYYKDVCHETNNSVKYYIADENGVDVTPNYRASTKYNYVTIEKRDITVETDSYNEEYDGKPHYLNGASDVYGDLCEGHTVVVTSDKSVFYRDVIYGYTNFLSFYIADELGEDVTDNYSVTRNYGTITISHRYIETLTESYSEYYDGASHEFNRVYDNGGYLCEGHTLVVTSLPVYYKNIYSGPNDTVTFYIANENGENVSENYNINELYGYIDIIKRPITVTTDSYNEVYDGKKHYLNGAYDSSGGLCNGHRITVTSDANVFFQNVIYDYINVLDFYIEDEIGENVSNNYDISIEWGTVTISHRPITVETESYDEYYDGKEHNLNGVTVITGTLCEDHIIAAGDSIYKDAVSSVENFVPVEIYDEYGTPVTSNYSVEYSYGTVNIRLRPITVTSDSYSAVYDGMNHSFSEVYISSGSLCEQQKLTITSGPNVYNGITDEINYFDFIIEDEYGVDVKYNYDITYEFGTVVITARPITVTSDSYFAVYDGINHDFSSVWVSEGSLAENQKIIVISGYNVYNNVTDEINSFDFIITDEWDENVTSNYEITYDFGRVNITHRYITVETETYNNPYDGVWHNINGTTVTEGTLCDGHYIVSDESLFMTVCEGVTNEFGFEIFNKFGAPVSDNYIVTAVYGTVTITKRQITVETESYREVYDGKEHNLNSITVTEGSICEGHFHISENSFFTNVTEPVENQFSISILDENGELVTENYEIKMVWGTVEILPRKITLETETYNEVYDGKNHSLNYVTDVYGDLCDGHRITSTGTIYKNVTETVENKRVIIIIDSRGKNATQNYEITAIWGTVTITKRDITIETQSYDGYYDGEEHNLNGFKVNSGSLCDGHTVVAEDSIFKDIVFGAENVFSFYIADEALENVTDNYNVETVWGTVNIAPRKITVAAESRTEIYSGKDYNFNQLVILDGDICEGHYFVSLNDSIFRDVISNATNHVDFYIADADGNDVTDLFYEIDYVDGTVNILPRDIYVEEDSYYGTYDGNEHFANGATDKYGDLCEGHTIVVTSEPIPYKDVISTENTLVTFYIADENGNNVTQNYNVHRVFGYIEILPRPITLETEGYEGVYDGKDHYLKGLTLIDGTLCEGHEIYCLGSDKLFNEVFEGVNDTVDFYIIDENGIYAGDNYDVTVIHGRVSITPRPITVITEGYDGIYDGKEHLLGLLEIKDGTLCEGHNLISGFNTFKNACENEENLVAIEFIDAEGNDVTENYEVIYVAGIVNIAKREISLVSESYEGVYDGKEHNLNRLRLTQGSLCEGHVISALDSIFKNWVENAENLVEFSILDSENEDVTANYLIDLTPGTVNIAKRQIVAEAESYKGVYDGKEHNLNKLSIITGSLCEGHSLAADDAIFTVTDGEVENLPAAYVYDAAGDDVTENYELTVIAGTVDIKKRAISVKTEGYFETYDGKEHNLNRLIIVSGELCEGHSFLAEDSVFKNVTDSELNEFTFEIVNGEGENCTQYYVITVEYGTVTISARPLTVTTESYNEYYDGEEHNLNSVIIKSGSLCEGHDFLSEDAIYKYVADSTDENAFGFVIVDADGENVTANYELSTSYGSVTIKHRPLEVITESKTWFYDGKAHSWPKFTVKSGFSVPECEELKYIFAAEIVEIGSIQNDIELAVFDKDGTDVTENYSIVITDYGMLTVKERDPDEPIVLFVIKSTTSGYVYLKQASYGKYNGNGFYAAPTYSELIEGELSAYYLAALAAKAYGKTEQNMLITPNPQSPYDMFVMPYYSAGKGDNIQSSDSVMFGNDDVEYLVYFYEIDDFTSLTLPEDLREYEARYAQFVYENYLDMYNEETIAFMQSIIDEQGFDPSDPDIIKKVANYIQNAADYSLDYNKALDSSTDIVIDFLKYEKVGVCRHYAMAATMLYRQLGIPARYTVGLMGEVLAGVESPIGDDRGHAWVEVYINGLGWIQVEVTGSSSDSDDPTPPPVPDPPTPENPWDITLETESYDETYDGKEHNVNKVTLIAGSLYYDHSLAYGDSIYKDICDNVANDFEITIVDSNGNDVTNCYNIEKIIGTVTIRPKKLSFETPTYKEEYDGKEHTFNEVILTAGSLVDGHQIVITSETVIYKLPVSETENKVIFHIEDADGNEVSANYSFEIIYGTIAIERREIKVKTESYDSVYDGEIHNLNKVNTVFGSLCEGHVFVCEDSLFSNMVNDAENKFNFYIADENGENVTLFYDMTVEYGTVNIRAYQITVETESYDSVYDGQDHNLNGFTLTEGQLIPGHSIVAEDKIYNVPVSHEENLVTVKIYDENGEDVTSYYHIVLRPGTVNIEKRYVQIETESYDGLFNKEAVNLNHAQITDGSLCEGHSLLVSDSFFNAITANGRNEAEITIHDKDGNDVTGYYDVDLIAGTVNIRSRGVIELVLFEQRFTYDGKLHSFTSDLYAVVSSSENINIVMHEINISMNNVGEVRLSDIINDIDKYLSYSIYEVGSDVDYFDCYEVRLISLSEEEDPVIMSILSNAITITTGSVSRKLKDGEDALTCNEFFVSFGSLPEGHTIYLQVIGANDSPGSVPNTYNKSSLRITDANGNDVTKNYKVSYITGTLTVE